MPLPKEANTPSCSLSGVSLCKRPREAFCCRGAGQMLIAFGGIIGGIKLDGVVRGTSGSFLPLLLFPALLVVLSTLEVTLNSCLLRLF